MQWTEKEETVRFNEVDEWGMAWHGHYIAWFEAGRMYLLRQFDLLPSQMVELGYIAPVIHLECDFKHPATSGDRLAGPIRWLDGSCPALPDHGALQQLPRRVEHRARGVRAP